VEISSDHLVLNSQILPIKVDESTGKGDETQHGDQKILFQIRMQLKGGLGITRHHQEAAL